jgi:hypothetical protein
VLGAFVSCIAIGSQQTVAEVRGKSGHLVDAYSCGSFGRAVSKQMLQQNFANT